VFRIIALLGVLFMAAEAHALSLSYLYGETFRKDLGYQPKKTTMTIEHFQLWEYGNVFFYYDLTEPFRSDNNEDAAHRRQASQFFGGFAPTLSLSKVTGKEVGYGIVKDVSLRVELENGSGYGVNNFRNYFFGLQYDLAIPGFDFFTFNTVLRDNPLSAGVGYQIGTFWQMSQEWGRWTRFRFMGFLATSPWDGNQGQDRQKYIKKATGGAVAFSNHGRYLTTQPQLLWDLGYALWGKPMRWEIGTEFDYFWNRYQLAGKDEAAFQAMTKLTF
jgi:nucleoside-specific outer membrane channel protein Tsx